MTRNLQRVGKHPRGGDKVLALEFPDGDSVKIRPIVGWKDDGAAVVLELNGTARPVYAPKGEAKLTTMTLDDL